MWTAAGMWVWNVVKPFLLYILLGLVTIGTVLAVLAKVKDAGRMQERVEGMTRTIEAVKENKKAKDDLAKEMRDNGESVRERLQRRWSRD